MQGADRLARGGARHRRLRGIASGRENSPTDATRTADSGRRSGAAELARGLLYLGFMNTLKEILVATDFGEASATALRYGRDLARRFGARLHVLHVVDLLPARLGGIEGYVPNLGNIQREIEEQSATDLDALLSDDDRTSLRACAVLRTSTSPAAEIVDYARHNGIDLILVGTHGRTAAARWLIGSVAEKVVRSAPCPVMTVRHPEHEFVLPDPREALARA